MPGEKENTDALERIAASVAALVALAVAQMTDPETGKRKKPWTQQDLIIALRGGGQHVVSALAADGANNIVLTGQMSGPVDLGGGPLNNVGGVFVAKYAPTGVHLWSRNYRGGGGQGPLASGRRHTIPM